MKRLLIATDGSGDSRGDAAGKIVGLARKREGVALARDLDARQDADRPVLVARPHAAVPV